ncbi:unnamed protein product [Rhizophagus irregularis]|nr:unnamed protein product [Rhizophagus irregularis]CAB4432253.1 unnamed protein product [Rhizophagus irregularis]
MEQEKTNLELHKIGGVIQAVKHVQRYADALSDGAITNLESASIPITSAERNERKRPAEKVSPTITPPPNLRNASTEASPSNDRYESDGGITREGDNNPFIAQTVEDSTKYKFVLSWSHAIDKVVINNFSENDWVTQNGHNIYQFSLILCLLSIISLTPKELPAVADLVIIEYSRLLSDKQLLNTKWRNNWSKGNSLLTDEDKDIFDCVQIVSRNFFIYLSYVSYNETSLVWANGESESSEERRLLDSHNYGKKPDFQILTKIDDTDRELMFGEIKPPHCPNTVNKSIIKLAEFMKDSLDLIINIYETYGILICESEIKIFSIDLAYERSIPF